MVKANIYTKDGYVRTPDGKEYASLKFALKAYNLDETEFMRRIETGCTLREAFVGIDLECGLQYGMDGKLHDMSGGAFSTLEEMCEAHKADVTWFNRLYKSTGDLMLSLRQKPEHKTEEYIISVEADKAEKLKLLQESAKKVAEEKAKKDELLKRVLKAKRICQIYSKQYLNTYALVPVEISWQILRLAEFIETYSKLDYDSKALVKKAQNSLDYGETNVIGAAEIPNHKLVQLILKDFACKRIIKKPSLAGLSGEDRQALKQFFNEDYGQKVKRTGTKKEKEGKSDGSSVNKRGPTLDYAKIYQQVQEIHRQQWLEEQQKELERRKALQEKKAALQAEKEARVAEVTQSKIKTDDVRVDVQDTSKLEVTQYCDKVVKNEDISSNSNRTSNTNVVSDKVSEKSTHVDVTQINRFKLQTVKVLKKAGSKVEKEINSVHSKIEIPTITSGINILTANKTYTDYEKEAARIVSLYTIGCSLF